MTASLLDGNLPANKLKQQLKQAVATLLLEKKKIPGLAVILVGEEVASSIYVNNKRKACKEVGFNSYAYDLPKSTTEKEVLHLIETLNHAPEVDGILVQLPLPKHIEESKIIERINPYKDVDGFHPYNMGRLTLRYPLLRPCTPAGIIHLLNFYQLPLKGKKVVIVGASNIVGRPMAMEFLLAKATVTVCHRFTEDLEPYVRLADIVVVAAGVLDVIDTGWLSQDQIVIDVGIHRQPDGTLRGDVNFEQAKNKVSWITPVPGGVGPMTIAMLLQNTFYAADLLTSIGQSDAPPAL